MRYERRAEEAFDEYRRLVAILNDELHWERRSADPEQLEAALGRPVVPAARQTLWSAAMGVFDELIVDAVAEAMAAGVTRKDLVDHRGWLSHKDIGRYVARASRPHASNYRPSWPQWNALELVLKDVDALAEVDAERAASLLRSARAFLRRWCKEIPKEPTAEQLAHSAAMWRDEHRRLYVEARAKFLKEVDQKTRPKSTA